MSTVVVTGSTKGVGFALANEFASRGWSVVISGRTMPAIDDALNRIRERTPNAQVAGAIVDGTGTERSKGGGHHQEGGGGLSIVYYY